MWCIFGLMFEPIHRYPSNGEDLSACDAAHGTVRFSYGTMHANNRAALITVNTPGDSRLNRDPSLFTNQQEASAVKVGSSRL
jgi:hypothetical protein